MRRLPLAAICLTFACGLLQADPLPLRQPNPALNVPAGPPATSLSLVDAFPLSFAAPTCLATEPNNQLRLYVCEKAGVIQLIPDVTATSPSKVAFFNLAGLVNPRSKEEFRNVSEAGLLGLAFHPNYAQNRYFYVFYSVRIEIGTEYELHQRVSRFTTLAGNPNAVDLTSEHILLQQIDDEGNHNGGDLHFGQDGYLYISVGDGGGQNDVGLNSQRIDKDFFSAIMRIDVDKKAGNLEPNPHPNPAEHTNRADAVQRTNGIAHYSIPADNPFVGAQTFNGLPVAAGYVRTEFWATGLRNPWRFSFDGEDLWCGDVGGSKREEVNRIEKGKNYGWIYREGLGTGGTLGSHPPQPAGFVHENPVHAYPRTGSSSVPQSEVPDTLRGESIVGGLIYRGGITSLYGKYIFGDHVSGHIWSMNPEGPTRNVTRLAGSSYISSFGTDPSNGDLLVTDWDSNKVLRLKSNTTVGNFPDTLSETGLFSNVASLTPAPGLIPYDVNLPFWSDHAVKARWFSVPNASATLSPSADGAWTLPDGALWVKHFEIEMERGNPASKKRLETRLLVKNAGGAYGVSYRWNGTGTEATLVQDAGESFPLEVTVGGIPAPQVWSIPARSQCMSCHTPQAGYALSFNTRQLNLPKDILGHSGNQLTTLFNQGYLSANPGSPSLLPRHLRADESDYSVEARVRSYLAVNCSYCHKTGGSAQGQWDGRPELLLSETGLINGNATNNGGNPANKLVVPGDTAHSIVLNRVAVSNGFTRMPPLGSNVIDTAAASLLSTWINGELDARQSYAEWRIANFEPDEDPSGEPGADADGDGFTNHEEYLAGTDPSNGSSRFVPQIGGEAGEFTLSFEIPVNRSYRIETSGDLDQWTQWDIPGNQGLPRAGGLVEIAIPTTDPMRFFRVELREN